MTKRKEAKTTGSVAYNGVIPNTPIKFIYYVSRPYALLAMAAIFAATLGQIAHSFSPYILQNLVDETSRIPSGAEAAEVFVFWGTIYLALLGSGFVFWRISGFVGMEWLTRLNQAAYTELYKYVSKHSHTYFTSRFAGALSNKISNASDGSERLVERSLWGWYTELISIMISFFLLFTVDVVIAFAFLAVFVFVLVVNIFMVKRRRPHVVAYAGASSKLRGQGVDMVTNISAVRQYARFSFELPRLIGFLDDRRLKDIKQWRMSEWSLVFNNMVITLFIGGVFVYLYTLLKTGAVTAGAVVLVVMVVGRVTKVLVFIGSVLNGLIREYGEIEEGLSEILVPHEVVDPENVRSINIKNAEIIFKEVNFSFAGNEVFSEFNLIIKPGQRIGLVGPSGAGKTTFVSLLLRQHDIDSGAIMIDGQNIAKVTQDSLRENIAVVPQEPLLFHRSIRENIAYGKPEATDEEIIEVAKKAQAHDFISSLSEGYDTLVGERGVKLSGGQKQRVAIARAMLKDAPILVLDEATSALDSESEVEIQKALHILMDGKTVVAIAHRLSTLREMDRIIVLDKGKIVEDGSHDALVNYGGVYARLWEHQAGGFLQE